MLIISRISPVHNFQSISLKSVFILYLSLGLTIIKWFASSVSSVNILYNSAMCDIRPVLLNIQPN